MPAPSDLILIASVVVLASASVAAFRMKQQRDIARTLLASGFNSALAELQTKHNRRVQELEAAIRNRPPVAVIDGATVEGCRVMVTQIRYEQSRYGLQTMDMQSTGPFPTDLRPGAYLLLPFSEAGRITAERVA